MVSVDNLHKKIFGTTRYHTGVCACVTKIGIDHDIQVILYSFAYYGCHDYAFYLHSHSDAGIPNSPAVDKEQPYITSLEWLVGIPVVIFLLLLLLLLCGVIGIMQPAMFN